MNAFYSWMAVILGMAMILSLYRVLKGPTVFDRLTGLGLIATKTVVLLVLLGVLVDRMDLYVDVSLAYALLGFVSPLVLAKYFEIGGKPSP